MRPLIALLGAMLLATVATGVCADAPAVSVTTPSQGVIIDQGLMPAVLFQASATDPDEAIRSVTFAVCRSPCASWNVVGSASAPPYQMRWLLPPPSGDPSSNVTLSYQVMATADNASGLTGMSQIVTFTVKQPPMPSSVTLVAPITETGYATPTSPVLYATAYNNTVPSSTVDHVDFLDGATVIGTVTQPNALPTGYAFVWQNAPLGMHLIFARATNTLGYSAISTPVTLYIIAPDPPPQVTLTLPLTGQIFAPGSTVALAANASSTLGTIQRVEFATADRVIDIALSPPYGASWVNPPPGNFAIVATA
jgi:hypothetical protein